MKELFLTVAQSGTDETNAVENVLSEAVKESSRVGDFLSEIGDHIMSAVPTILIALLVFIVGFVITRILLRIFTKCMDRSNADGTAASFLRSLLKILLLTINLIITLSVLKIPMTSIIAVLSAAGLAVGLALQNSLSNLAGGFIILFSKPFKAGDYIETNSSSGNVESISILYTKIITVDNKTVYIPNGKVADSLIINYSEQDCRRVDFEFGISYSEDFEKAKEIILSVADEYELVLNEPETLVRLGKQEASSLQIITNVWTKTENYWTVKYDMMEMVTKAFQEKGISIPYNQLDVHIN